MTDCITNSGLPDVSSSVLSHTRILITGGTGLVGSALVRLLTDLNRSAGASGELLLLSRGRAQNSAAGLSDMEGIIRITGDITDPETFCKISGAVDYIIHCAAVTRSQTMISAPADVSESIVSGTLNVLKFACEKHVKSIVNLSTMEVYGTTDKEYVSEKDLGAIDLYHPRSCYPAAKRMAESLCYSYFCQYGLSVKSARLAQTFGAGTPETDTRVFAQFGRSVKNGEDIVLHTPGSTMGNYVDTQDAAAALLLLLLRGKDGEAYNVSNPANCMTVRQMADMTARELAGGKIRVRLDIPETNRFGYPPSMGWKLNADKMMALGWKPRYTLREMYQRMLAGWNAAMETTR